MASLNMVSINFAQYRMAAKYKNWKFDWEKPYLESSDDYIFRNTFRDISHILKELREGCGTGFEFECCMTLDISTISRISSTTVWSSRRFWFRASSGSWVALVRTRRISP